MITAEIIIMPVMIFSLSIFLLTCGVASFFRGVAITKKYQKFARIPGKLKRTGLNKKRTMGAMVEVVWAGQVYLYTAPRIYSLKEENITVLFDNNEYIGLIEIDNWTTNGKAWKIVGVILALLALVSASLMSFQYFDISL